LGPVSRLRFHRPVRFLPDQPLLPHFVCQTTIAAQFIRRMPCGRQTVKPPYPCLKFNTNINRPSCHNSPWTPNFFGRLKPPTGTGESRSYRLDRIRSATVTRKPFQARFTVELTASGPLAAPPLERAGDSASAPTISFSAAPRTSPRLRQVKAAGNSDMKYSFECTVCGKRFTRSTYDATLNPHKNKQGWPCPGRIGILK
jgi:hypothetical protein